MSKKVNLIPLEEVIDKTIDKVLLTDDEEGIYIKFKGDGLIFIRAKPIAEDGAYLDINDNGLDKNKFTIKDKNMIALGYFTPEDVQKGEK